MMKKQISHFCDKERALHRLLLQAKFMKDAGLLDGKMGVVLAFAELYRRTSLPAYEAYMEEFLDELMEELPETLSIHFGGGLSGIGWGIEYLIQHGFVSGDSLDICSELDERIMQTDIRRMTDTGLETGLEGLMHYFLAHIQGVWDQRGKLPFDEAYLADVFTAAQRAAQNQPSDSLDRLLRQYIAFRQSGKVQKYTFGLSEFILSWQTGQDIMVAPLGLRHGLAAFLLERECK